MINQMTPTGLVDNATSEQEIQSIENQYWVDMAQALERLENGNARPDDFKKVILEGYFKDKAINGVSILGSDYVRRNGVRGEVMEELVAISHLQDYFITLKNLGTVAPDEDFDGMDEG